MRKYQNLQIFSSFCSIFSFFIALGSLTGFLPAEVEIYPYQIFGYGEATTINLFYLSFFLFLFFIGLVIISQIYKDEGGCK